jgi:hypothetical protein
MAGKKDDLVERAQRVLQAAKKHAEKLGAAGLGAETADRLDKALASLKKAGPAGAASRGKPTVGQLALMRQIGERVREIQDAIVRVFPNNPGLRQEFRVGVDFPGDTAGALEYAKAVEPQAREYQSNLLSRGVDAGRLIHLRRLIADLEKEAERTPTAGGPSADAGMEVEKLCAEVVAAAQRAFADAPEPLVEFTGAPKAPKKKKAAPATPAT